MRIVAGEFRGRRLTAPKGDATRPTTDRVREALFSTLASIAGPSLGGGVVLDAFAGSGALGLEALSRGCASAVFAEKDRHALSALRRNIAELNVGDRTTVLPVDAFSLGTRTAASEPFALILLDPPYTLDQTKVSDLLESLASRGLLTADAVVSWEHASGVHAPWPKGFTPVKQKRYGTTEVDVAIWEGGTGEL